MQLGLADVEEAARVLARYVHRTPLVGSRSISARLGYEVRFKAENLQKCGAFKARGAHWKLSRLAPGVPGVVTFSSGNHGQAVALAARTFGLRAVVVVPTGASPVKVAAMQGYGAEVVFEGATSVERQRRAEAIAAERGYAVVPPFDDAAVVVGQGTAALEVRQYWPEVRRLDDPVGGGGLLGETILAAGDVEVVAVEPTGAPTLARALEAGRPVDLGSTDTIADGLQPVKIGALNFELARDAGIRPLLVSDASIVDAMRLVLERLKLLVEPSGAAGLAALLEHALPPAPTAVILTGGNVALERLGQLLGTRP